MAARIQLRIVEGAERSNDGPWQPVQNPTIYQRTLTQSELRKFDAEFIKGQGAMITANDTQFELMVHDITLGDPVIVVLEAPRPHARPQLWEAIRNDSRWKRAQR
jgi:hypothetical protein